MIFISLLIVSGCSGDELVAPESGITFVIDPDSNPGLENYELQMYPVGDTGFSVVTLNAEDGRKVTWAQSLVDKKQGITYEVHVHAAYNGSLDEQDLEDKGPVFMLTFENGSTDQGRLIKVKVDQ